MYHKEKTVLLEAARRAGAVLLALSARNVAVDYKGEIDLVTEADRRSERTAIAAIRKAFPGDDILTEESDKERTESPRRWIIDPLDGTTNYAHRFPFWCVSIAFEHRGRLELGAVNNPRGRELFFAQRDKGAWLNGRRIRVSREAALSRSLLGTGFPYDVRTSRDNNLEHFGRFIKASQAVRRPGSAALDLAYVACGRCDGFWERGLKPWDCAAATLMVAEAGGRVTDYAGAKYSVYGRECLASNGKIHRQMMVVLHAS